MSVRAAYTNWAATYDSDRNLTRDLDGVVTRRMLTDQPRSAILELGCGTGKNTLFLAQIGERVCALDLTEGMIAHARTKLAQTQVRNVHFTIADLTQPFPCVDDRFDLVVCNLVLEHIADLAPVFAEAYRVLTDGGRFFICELHPFKQYLGGKANFQRGDQQVEIAAFVHHISAFLDAADSAGFTLKRLNEWWHDDDPPDGAPRLVSFLFQK